MDFSEWWKHWAFWPVVSMTGDRISGMVMRRRAPDGTWQYRKMTEAEDYEEQSTN